MNPLKKFFGTDVVALQLEAVHEDVMMGFLKAFARRGLRTQVFINERIKQRRGDFFAELPRLRKTVINYVPLETREDWEALIGLITKISPKGLFFNTFQRDGQANLMTRLDLPAWGVVHNPKAFAASEECVKAAQSGQLTTFVLASHVAKALEDLLPCPKPHTYVHHPISWTATEDDGWALPEKGAPLKIAIPGAVAFASRSWAQLLDQLCAGGPKPSRSVRYLVIAGGPERALLEERVHQNGMDQFFEFEPTDPATGFVPHRRLLRQLCASHAIMPMLPPDRTDFTSWKISTAIPQAIGFARPLFLPEGTAAVYGVPAIAMPSQRPWDLSGVDLSNARLTRAREEAIACRASMRSQNAKTLAPLLERF